MFLMWSTKFLVRCQDDRLVLQGRTPSVLWPTAVSAVLAAITAWSVLTHRGADAAVGERLVIVVLGVAWFTTICFGMWLSIVWSFHKPFVFDRRTNRFSRGQKVICPLSAIGRVQLHREEHEGSSIFQVSVLLAKDGQKVWSCVPLQEAERLACQIADFVGVRVERTGHG
jgi:hypothetical protein